MSVPDDCDPDVAAAYELADPPVGRFMPPAQENEPGILQKPSRLREYVANGQQSTDTDRQDVGRQ